MKTVTKDSNMSSKTKLSTKRTCTSGSLILPYLKKSVLEIKKKKFLGIDFENKGYISSGIVLKCYILKSSKNENDENVKKMKDLSFRLNDDIELES
jgi:hypothetical protein